MPIENENQNISTTQENSATSTENNITQNEGQSETGTDIQNNQTETEETSGAEAISKMIDEFGLTEDSPANEENPAQVNEQKPNEEKQEQKQENQEKQQEQPPAQEETDEQFAESIKSERGKSRFKKLIEERNQYREQADGYSREVQAAGLDREAHANLLNISRLVSSSNPEDITQGLKMLEAVRTNLYQSLGREAPGVDLLGNAPDLREKVDSMAMSREDAIAIMNARRFQEEQKAMAQRQQQAQIEAQQYQAKIAEFGKKAEQAFTSRSQELDFEPKLNALKQHFSNPENVQKFVQANPPERWGDALMWMYDNVAVGQRRAQTNHPITMNQTRSAGNRVAKPMVGSTDSIMSRIEELGI